MIEANSTYDYSFYTTMIKLYAGNTYSIAGTTTYSGTARIWRVYDLEKQYVGYGTGKTYTPTEDCYARIMFRGKSDDSGTNAYPSLARRKSVILTYTAADGQDSPTYIQTKVVEKGSTGNIELIAQWEKLPDYTLTVDPNGGIYNGVSTPSILETPLIYLSTNLNQINISSRAGYTFKGYYDAPTGGNLVYQRSEDTYAECINGDYWQDNKYIKQENLTVYAQWIVNTASISINKNNSAWSNSSINVALYQSGTNKYPYNTANISDTSISWNMVEDGTYDIYASKNANSQADLNTLVDTGIKLIVDTTGEETIDYYTLDLTKGVGISAVSGAGIYLKNQAANIDATVANGYTWEGWSVISGDSPN